MTLLDLIESLQDIADELGEVKAAETEVRLAIQPRWAFEHSIAGVALSTELAREEEDDEDSPTGEDEEDAPAIVYLAEGNQIGYAPPGIWEAAR